MKSLFYALVILLGGVYCTGLVLAIMFLINISI